MTNCTIPHKAWGGSRGMKRAETTDGPRGEIMERLARETECGECIAKAHGVEAERSARRQCSSREATARQAQKATNTPVASHPLPRAWEWLSGSSNTWRARRYRTACSHSKNAKMHKYLQSTLLKLNKSLRPRSAFPSHAPLSSPRRCRKSITRRIWIV
jgi:hypothetical protein